MEQVSNITALTFQVGINGGEVVVKNPDGTDIPTQKPEIIGDSFIPGAVLPGIDLRDLSGYSGENLVARQEEIYRVLGVDQALDLLTIKGVQLPKLYSAMDPLRQNMAAMFLSAQGNLAVVTPNFKNTPILYYLSGDVYDKRDFSDDQSDRYISRLQATADQVTEIRLGTVGNRLLVGMVFTMGDYFTASADLARTKGFHQAAHKAVYKSEIEELKLVTSAFLQKIFTRQAGPHTVFYAWVDLYR
jgi:hypothetical protein